MLMGRKYGDTATEQHHPKQHLGRPCDLNAACVSLVGRKQLGSASGLVAPVNKQHWVYVWSM